MSKRWKQLWFVLGGTDKGFGLRRERRKPSTIAVRNACSKLTFEPDCKLLESGMLTWCKAGNFVIISPRSVHCAEYKHCPNYAVATFRKVRRKSNFCECRN